MAIQAPIEYELARRVAFLAKATGNPLAHHERFDGIASPRGLVGQEIPIGWRILAADTPDAMTGFLAYRLALPTAAAGENVIRGTGRQFDPAAIKVFLTTSEGRLAINRQGQLALEHRHGIEAPLLGDSGTTLKGDHKAQLGHLIRPRSGVHSDRTWRHAFPCGTHEHTKRGDDQ